MARGRWVGTFILLDSLTLEPLFVMRVPASKKPASKKNLHVSQYKHLKEQKHTALSVTGVVTFYGTPVIFVRNRSETTTARKTSRTAL